MSATAVATDVVTGLRPRVLVVEDSPDHLMLMERALRKAGYEVVGAATGEAAVAQLPGVDVALVDQRLPNMSGMELLEEIARLDDGPAPVVVTGAGSQELVVGAMRRGAVDYVVKSSTYLDELPAVVQRAYRQHDLARRNRELQRFALLVHEPTARQDALHEIVQAARRLLRATGVCLALESESGWDIAATDGTLDDPEELLRDLVLHGLEAVELGEGRLAVALPADPDEPAGILLSSRPPEPPYGQEERGLAATFAAFAASALRQVRRLELERGLIDQLQRSIRARQDFVASVSHELRTPLTAIGGYAETIQTRGEAIPPRLRDDLLTRIRNNASDLERLIDQLLDVAGLERGRTPDPSLSAIPLGEAVADLLDGLSFHLEGRDVVTDIEDVTVLADPDLLDRTLANLVSNAAKYSAPGSPVAVRARRQESGHRVRIEVSDQGIGLDTTDAARVFEPFWRAGYAVAEAVRGTGIGLALVREYVRAMDGEVGVDSELGAGSTFWFTLPVA